MNVERDEAPAIRMSPEIGALAAALAAAQAEFPTVQKDNTAKVETSKGPGYSYKYADLASCLEAVRGPLSRHKLAVMQPTTPTGRDVLLTTILAHESGQWIASDLPLVADWSRPQAMGSVITYARRYALCALLQIATDDDNGQAAEAQRQPARAERRPAPARRERPADGDRPIMAYREWLDSYAAQTNQRWLDAGHPGPKGAKPLVTTYGINKHLLKSLDCALDRDEAVNFRNGAEFWKREHEAMRAEAKAYCRRLYEEATAKPAGREPGSDDVPPPAGAAAGAN